MYGTELVHKLDIIILTGSNIDMPVVEIDMQAREQFHGPKLSIAQSESTS